MGAFRSVLDMIGLKEWFRQFPCGCCGTCADCLGPCHNGASGHEEWEECPCIVGRAMADLTQYSVNTGTTHTETSDVGGWYEIEHEWEITDAYVAKQACLGGVDPQGRFSGGGARTWIGWVEITYTQSITMTDYTLSFNGSNCNTSFTEPAPVVCEYALMLDCSGVVTLEGKISFTYPMGYAGAGLLSTSYALLRPNQFQFMNGSSFGIAAGCKEGTSDRSLEPDATGVSYASSIDPAQGLPNVNGQNADAGIITYRPQCCETCDYAPYTDEDECEYGTSIYEDRCPCLPIPENFRLQITGIDLCNTGDAICFPGDPEYCFGCTYSIPTDLDICIPSLSGTITIEDFIQEDCYDFDGETIITTYRDAKLTYDLEDGCGDIYIWEDFGETFNNPYFSLAAEACDPRFGGSIASPPFGYGSLSIVLWASGPFKVTCADVTSGASKTLSSMLTGTCPNDWVYDPYAPCTDSPPCHHWAETTVQAVNGDATITMCCDAGTADSHTWT